MSDFKSQQIKSVLKDLLKKKKLTYEMVAEELQCSVPTVKRVLGPEELSLPRLLQLCDLLDINLADLETLTTIKTSTDAKFTEAQDVFLAKNNNFLAYLILLYSMTPAQIAEEYKLSDRSTDKYLMGLEKQDLVKINGKLKVRPTFKEMPHFGSGVLAKAYYEKFITNGAQFFVQNISDGLYSTKQNQSEGPPKGFSIHAMKVTESSYRQFAKELSKAFDAFQKLASYEEKSMSENELKTAVFLQAFSFVEHSDKNLDLLKDTFGKVTNI